MHASRAISDQDRLPWLEPYREPVAAREKPARRISAGPMLTAAVVATLIAAGAGGYWLGQRSEGPGPSVEPTRPAAPSAQTVVPLPEPRPMVTPARPPEAEPLPPPAIEAPTPAERVSAAPAKRAKPRARPRRKIRSAGVESARLTAVRAAQERTRARTAVRSWPKMPSPGPAGQVIQLGAFTTASRAQAAYRSRVARYPVLATMPRVIVPIIPRSERRLYYVLRLGTASRDQSKLVCRNLRISGDHCLVIG